MATNIQPILQDINWIDVTDPTPGEMQQLSQQYGLNEHIVRDCMQPEHLPKYEFVEDVHFLILRYYARPSDKRVTTIQDQTNKIAIFFTSHFFITIHKSELTFLELLKRQAARGKWDTTADVLLQVCWQTLETFEEPGKPTGSHRYGQIDPFACRFVL
ncbi:CorA family divalent cation transporter [Paraflavisolibacter sp. H34]|uniref:CorA family divalent cation transporter n=1 Tax=Huijunlia imazamoxiresistens TaxID=3127457 RepID=UPI0030168560